MGLFRPNGGDHGVLVVVPALGADGGELTHARSGAVRADDQLAAQLATGAEFDMHPATVAAERLEAVGVDQRDVLLALEL